MSLSSTIAKLRREHGMTQENLAELIGVSPQTVSKWETATTYPDVTLLPLLADIFGVTIDALYGRTEAFSALSAQETIDQVAEETRCLIAALSWSPEDRPYPEALAAYRRALADGRQRSMVQSDREFLYFREPRGVLALRRPEGGWHALFEDEGAAALLALLADGDFRRAMSAILQRRMQTFTLASLMRAAHVEDGAHLEQCLVQSQVFLRKEVAVEEGSLVFWEFCNSTPRVLLMYAALAFAQEAAHYESVHYCYYGNNECAWP